MANTTYATVIGGSLTGKGFTKLLGGAVPRSWQTQDLTGPQDAGVSVIETNRPSVAAHLIGVYRSSTGPDVFPKPIGSSGAALTMTGSPFWRSSRARIAAVRVLENASGGETPWDENEWLEGNTIYQVRANGWLGDDDALLEAGLTGTPTLTESTIANLVFPLSATVSISGEARVTTYVPQMRGSGASKGVPAELTATYTGAVATTNTPLAEASCTAVMDLDTGVTWSASLLMNRVEVDIDYRSGAKTRVGCQGQLNGTITIT